MNTFRYNIGVVKIGTEVVTNRDTGNIERNVIEHLVDQIADIRSEVNHVIVVTSGAVALGRADMRGAKDFSIPDEAAMSPEDLLDLKRLYASVGQPILHRTYADALRIHGLRAPQVLLKKPDELRNIFGGALNLRSLVPIINENDAIASDQFFSDNDDLAQHVAEIVRADFVCFLTSVNGLRRDMHDPNSIIHAVAPDDEMWRTFVEETTSKNGKGGMPSKCERAQSLARQGIWAHIADGRQEDVLQRILGGEAIGTRFLAAEKS